MGGIFGGKPKQSSSSSNQAFGQIRDTFTPITEFAGVGGNALQALLGGDSTGFDKFKQATGFNAAAESGSRGITGNAAARGLLQSGSTAKRLQSFGNEIQNQYAGNYMDRLLGLSNLGLGAGGLIAGAGNVSSSKSKGGGKSGLGNALGMGAQLIAASDRRLKKNIKKLSEYEDGLGIYQYHYIDGSGPHIGVMADEVERLRPEALGPVIDGYMTVDYSKLEVVNG